MKLIGTIIKCEFTRSVHDDNYILAITIDDLTEIGELKEEFLLTKERELLRISKILKSLEVEEVEELRGRKVVLYFDENKLLTGLGNTKGAVVPRLWKPEIFSHNDFIEMSQKISDAEHTIREAGGLVQYDV